MNRRHQRGIVLIVTLWIVAILSVLFIGLAFRFRMELVQSRYFLEQIQTRYLAQAGLQAVYDRLSRDTTEFDSLYLCGIDLMPEETPASILKNDSLGAGGYQCELTDEERKIHIEKATPDLLKRIKGLSERQIMSIMDWLDEDDIEDFDGAESRYYGSLPHPYAARNGPIRVMEELLLIRYMTPQAYARLCRIFTPYGDGLLNIHTASAEVMEAAGLSGRLIERIERYRDGLDEIPGTADDPVITDLEEFEFPEMTPAENVEWTLVKNVFKVGSAYFRIEARGYLGNQPNGASTVIDAVVHRTTQGAPEFVYYRES